MKVDVQSLGTFNQLAREGAQEATWALSQMTGNDADVDVTKITLTSRADVGEELADGEFVGVEFGFDGALEGDTVLVFESGSVEPITDALRTGGVDGGMTESSVKEIGNIMTSGFVDGWANVLQTTLDHTPPRLVHDMGRAIVGPLAAQVGHHQEHAFIVDSTMKTDGIAFQARSTYFQTRPNCERRWRAWTSSGYTRPKRTPTSYSDNESVRREHSGAKKRGADRTEAGRHRGVQSDDERRRSHHQRPRLPCRRRVVRRDRRRRRSGPRHASRGGGQRGRSLRLEAATGDLVVKSAGQDATTL